MWKHLLRAGLVTGVLAALLVLGACTFTIQPETNPPAPETGTDTGTAVGGAAGEEMGEEMGEMAVAEFVLPDGTSCLYSGAGATVAFDDKRVNYTCEPVDASVDTTETHALLNEPVIAGPTEYLVDYATVAQTDGGFELHESRAITFTAWKIVLSDGRECLHAGFGATMGFDGKRLNYTCDKGDSTADEVGLMGELSNAGDGVWLAQIDEIGQDSSGFTQLSSSMVPVAEVSGVEVRFDEESQATPAATESTGDLVGTTWQWVETQYGDDTTLAPDDPSQYTLTFDGTGRVAVQLDCNQGVGDYTLDGASLIFGALTSTLMACPDGSLATDFADDLAQVYSYVIEDGHLYLSMQLDSGIIEFAPAHEGANGGAEMTGTPTPEAEEEADSTPTPSATEEGSEEEGADD